MRTAIVKRTTAETDIQLTLNIDGSGDAKIDTGIGFLDHMLTLFACHGLFDLTLSCRGDLKVDGHHTTEDVGIALGEAFAKALGDKKGIVRYGNTVLPMDEALVLAAVDLSGRCCLCFDVTFPTEKIGSFDCELVSEFFYGFCRAAGVTLHVKKLAGTNSHHLSEACFKAFGRILRAASAPDPARGGALPSTKGAL